MYSKEKLARKMECIIQKYQSRLRKGRSVIDQIFTPREIQVESYKYEEDTAIAFVEFKQVNRIK